MLEDWSLWLFWFLGAFGSFLAIELTRFFTGGTTLTGVVRSISQRYPWTIGGILAATIVLFGHFFLGWL